MNYDKVALECSITDALNLTGLSLKNTTGHKVADPSDRCTYLSPFRNETKPSFAVYRDKSDGHWRFHDHASRESGNMINFVALAQNATRGEAAKQIAEYLNLDSPKPPKGKSKSRNLENIKIEEFTELSKAAIASVVGIEGSEGIDRLREWGMIDVGTMFCVGPNRKKYAESDCWFLYDEQTRSATARKLSGEPFGSIKSRTPNNWHKSPIGIQSIAPDAIYDESWTAVYCEGEKDLIAVMHGTPDERVIPVCMPSATTSLKASDASVFRDMSCAIYAQADREGIIGAKSWFEWLRPHAFEITMYVPKEMGADWADLAKGLTASEAESLLRTGSNFEIYENDTILGLNPEDYPNAKSASTGPKKKGGSPLDVENMKRCYAAWLSLPESEKDSVASVCKALGAETRGAERQKVARGLENALKALHIRILLQLYGVNVTAVNCNYSEQVA